MRPLLRLTAVFALLAISGCAPIHTGSFVDQSVDFSKYHSYNWAPSAQRSTGDARLEKNAVFQDHLQGEVEKQFAAKGFKGPTSRKPDLLLRYRAATTSRVNVNGVESGYGYCSSDCSARVVEYEAATLVLDVVDARTRKVVWRGWSQDHLDDLLDNQDRMARRLQEAITKMLEKFPANA
jgi:hypothetical protein